MCDIASGWTRSPAYCVMIALGAAALGCVAAATMHLAAQAPQARDAMALLTVLVPAVIVVTAVAMTIAVPVSLVVGAPLLWLSQGLVRRWPIPATIVLGLVGMFLGMTLHDALDRGSLYPGRYLPAMLLFGATVAAAHPVLLYHRWRRAWPPTLLTAAASGLVLIVAGRMALDRVEFGRARAQYAAECRAESGVYSPAPAIQSPPGSAGPASVTRHAWYSEGRGALLRNYAALFVGGRRALVINDVALAPVTLRSRMTGTRRIEQHCLAVRTDPDAVRARAAGLVSEPPAMWPNDRRWW